MLLLSGSPASLAFNSPYREEQNNDEEDDSSDEEDDEAVQDEEVAHFAVAKRVSLSPTRSVYTEEQDDAEAVNVSVDGDVEDMVIGLMAAQIALPDSPYVCPLPLSVHSSVTRLTHIVSGITHCHPRCSDRRSRLLLARDPSQTPSVQSRPSPLSPREGPHPIRHQEGSHSSRDARRRVHSTRGHHGRE
jgi:hypothetical protein